MTLAANLDVDDGVGLGRCRRVHAAAPLDPHVTGLAQGTTYSLQWTGGATTGARSRRPPNRSSDASMRCCRTTGRTRRSSGSTLRATPSRSSSRRSSSPYSPSPRRVHAASDGCFDPTVRPLVRAWGFDGENPAVPPAAAIEAARAIVGLDQARADRREPRSQTQPRARGRHGQHRSGVHGRPAWRSSWSFTATRPTLRRSAARS